MGDRPDGGVRPSESWTGWGAPPEGPGGFERWIDDFVSDNAHKAVGVAVNRMIRDDRSVHRGAAWAASKEIRRVLRDRGGVPGELDATAAEVYEATLNACGTVLTTALTLGRDLFPSMFPSPSSFLAYLGKSVVNSYIDIQRKKFRGQELPLDETQSHPDAILDPPLPREYAPWHLPLSRQHLELIGYWLLELSPEEISDEFRKAGVEVTPAVVFYEMMILARSFNDVLVETGLTPDGLPYDPCGDVHRARGLLSEWFAEFAVFDPTERRNGWSPEDNAHLVVLRVVYPYGQPREGFKSIAHAIGRAPEATARQYGRLRERYPWLDLLDPD